MTAPSRVVRQLTYLRDGHRCVSCGAHSPLEWNHREASGHGGRGRKAPPLTTADGVTLCTLCNEGIEGHMQARALEMGWKIRRNRGDMAAHEIPYYDYTARGYFLPTRDGMRQRISRTLALELLDAAGNLTRRLA